MPTKGRPAGGYPPPPPPLKRPPDYSVCGRSETGQLRARPVLFGLFAVIEELAEYSDGRQRWERIRYPVALGERR